LTLLGIVWQYLAAMKKLYIITLICLVGVGCGHIKQDIAQPEKILEQYQSHLKKQKVDKAASLLSKRLSQSIADDVFKDFVDNGGQQLKDDIGALIREKKNVVFRASIHGESGRKVDLIREEDQWRIEGGFLVPEKGYSPRSALLEFLSAIEERDCERLVKSAPPKSIRGFSKVELVQGCKKDISSLEKIAQQILKTKMNPEITSQDAAELKLNDQKTLTLVRYQEQWFIEDIR
jgi:hypothetical protein